MAVAFPGCGGDYSKDSKGGFDSGGKIEYTGVAFTMVAVPAVSFSTGTKDASSGSVTTSYEIAQTEVTYELWKAVYDWATSGAGGATGEGRYTFAHAGRSGSGGTDNQQPVTTVSWRDAIVWCNALTEYYAAKGGTVYDCVYYTDAGYTAPFRESDGKMSIDATAGQADNPYVNPAAMGFRLPTSMEWELAARYITDGNNDGDIKDDGEYYPGRNVSGDTTGACYLGSGESGTLSTVYGDYAWHKNNSSNYPHPVKSKIANALGLYDICGNVFEWCFDWKTIGNLRVTRGGCYLYDVLYSRIGFPNGSLPYYAGDTIGFRPTRTK